MLLLSLHNVIITTPTTLQHGLPNETKTKVHCDEALACAMLKILPEWSDAVIVRTRDGAELAKCDAVVDVGGVYDPATLRCA